MTNNEITIPVFLRIEPGALSKLGTYLKDSGFKNTVVFFGNGLIDMFGQTVIKSLNEADIDVLEYMELDSVSLEDVNDIAFNLPNKTQAVIGLGGGKVIDVAKYTAYLTKLPFISVPTSSSTDGFASGTASLLVKGRRTSVPAKTAYGIAIDTDVIRTAPDCFLYSGIGDMLSKITANYDWIYEEKCGVSKVNDFAMMIAKKSVNSFVRTPFTSIKDDLFLRELMDSLAMSGVANEIAGSSAPTSGSEHLISHALDKMLEKPQLHGIQVGISTYLMSLVQEHRFERVRKVFTDTGFFDYVKTLSLNVDDYMAAIDKAPSIKPHRHVYLHDEQYREKAKKLLTTDPILKDIFK
ncbi:MAG: iron-containing alcohol dehydrogenase family protein [Lachnospiraceae bacterium]|nr:iron-containing alcohol dehydrogenase family protein [Lachnospiraceae bacterium]MBR6485794.1 iron-containing alcohol dehydrogenase family protein [Lachnospiraceae bacterium]